MKKRRKSASEQEKKIILRLLFGHQKPSITADIIINRTRIAKILGLSLTQIRNTEKEAIEA